MTTTTATAPGTFARINTAPIFRATDGRAYRIAVIDTLRGTPDTGVWVFLACVVKTTGEDYASGAGVWTTLTTLRTHIEDTDRFPNLWVGTTNARAIVAFVDAYLSVVIAPATAEADATAAREDIPWARCGYGCGNLLDTDDRCPAACGILGAPDATPAAPAPRVLSSVTPSYRVKFPPFVSPRRSRIIADIVRGILAGDAGGTYHGSDGYAARYVVGGAGDSVVVRANAARSHIIATVHAFVSDAPILGGEGVGYWRDAATGRVWLDRVSFYSYAPTAREVARDRGEIAVWDATDAVEIFA